MINLFVNSMLIIDFIIMHDTTEIEITRILDEDDGVFEEVEGMSNAKANYYQVRRVVAYYEETVETKVHKG